MHWFSKEDCASLESCYLNNPATPYGLLMLPRGVDESKNFTEWGVPLLNMTSEYSPTWRL